MPRGSSPKWEPRCRRRRTTSAILQQHEFGKWARARGKGYVPAMLVWARGSVLALLIAAAVTLAAAGPAVPRRPPRPLADFSSAAPAAPDAGKGDGCLRGGKKRDGGRVATPSEVSLPVPIAPVHPPRCQATGSHDGLPGDGDGGRLPTATRHGSARGPGLISAEQLAWLAMPHKPRSSHCLIACSVGA